MKCGFTLPRGEQAHGYLWLRLSNAGHARVIAAGRDLSVLRRDRNTADYDLDNPLSQPIAASQVRAANDIIRVLEAAALDPLMTQITDAMKIYERDVLKSVTWHP